MWLNKNAILANLLLFYQRVPLSVVHLLETITVNHFIIDVKLTQPYLPHNTYRFDLFLRGKCQLRNFLFCSLVKTPSATRLIIIVVFKDNQKLFIYLNQVFYFSEFLY